ncbi:class I SAM-dependent methyltransferase [bacterium]|nr:class I SAM-dependent methyltransferase [bacterium]
MSIAHREYFNTLAPEWSVRMTDDQRFRNLLLRFGVSKGDCVLDAGAGTGRMTRHLSELVGQKGQVVAQDFALEMVREGRRQIPGSGVFWICDDLCALSCPSNMFDKVLCFSVFPHIQHPDCALKEIYRVLRPGGKLLILHTSHSTRLNAFHASLEGVVRSDRLPAADEMTGYFNKAKIEPVAMIDETDLYWVEGRKPDKSFNNVTSPSRQSGRNR